MHLKEDDEYVSFFLHASRYSGEVVNMEPHKCDDLSWFDIDDLPPNTIPYVRRAIQNYRDGVWFDSLGWPPCQLLVGDVRSLRPPRCSRTSVSVTGSRSKCGIPQPL